MMTHAMPTQGLNLSPALRGYYERYETGMEFELYPHIPIRAAFQNSPLNLHKVEHGAHGTWVGCMASVSYVSMAAVITQNSERPSRLLQSFSPRLVREKTWPHELDICTSANR